MKFLVILGFIIAGCASVKPCGPNGMPTSPMESCTLVISPLQATNARVNEIAQAVGEAQRRQAATEAALGQLVVKDTKKPDIKK